MQAGTLISPRLAEEAINSRLTCLPIESLPLTQCVGGTLRENIYAERDQPPFDRVTMDGIAVDSAALRRGLQALSHSGYSGGRHSADQARRGRGRHRSHDRRHPAAGQRLRHSRRAVGCRRRLRLAQCRRREFGLSQRASARQRQPAGRLLLEAGTLLRAPEIAVAASAGMARVRVSSQPAVMVMSTGDELIEPGDPIADYQVRRSNAYAVAATLRKRGLARVGDDHVPDDEAVLQERLALHLTTHEVVVLSGGVSMGKFDFVPKVLVQPRRAGGVSQHRAAARQTHVVRHRTAGTSGIRLARKSGLDPGVPDPLCHSRHRRGHGHQARAARAPGVGRAGHLSAAAGVFPAGHHRTR